MRTKMSKYKAVIKHEDKEEEHITAGESENIFEALSFIAGYVYASVILMNEKIISIAIEMEVENE